MLEYFTENDTMCERFIAHFEGKIIHRHGVQGLNVSEQWLAVNDRDGMVYLYVCIDNGTENDTQLMVDMIMYDPEERGQAVEARMARVLGVTVEKARGLLTAAGL